MVYGMLRHRPHPNQQAVLSRSDLDALILAEVAFDRLPDVAAELLKRVALRVDA